MLDKKRVFRASGIVPLIGLSVTAIFIGSNIYESLAKAWLEVKLTQAYGAKIDIQDLKISPLKGTAFLKNIQLTNPSDPLKNLIEIGNISLKFNRAELLRKKLVIDLIEASEIKAATRRTRSGIIDDLISGSEAYPVLWEKADVGGFQTLRNQIKNGPLKYLSQITTGAYTLSKMPNLKKSLASLQYLQEINHKAEAANREWNNQASLLPTGTQLNEWQTTIAKWANSPREIASAHDIEGRKQLAVQIRAKHAQISGQLDSALKHFTLLKAETDAVNNLLEKDLETLKKELSLPSQASEDLSSSLFGHHVISVLEKINYWIDIYRNPGNSVFLSPDFEVVKWSSPNRTEYHFLKRGFSSDFEIKKLTVVADKNDEKKPPPFAGELSHFILFPDFFKTNCKAIFSGNIPGLDWEGLKIQADLTSDSDLSNDSIEVSVDSFPLEDFILKSTPDFSIKITSSTAKFKANGSFKSRGLNANGTLETIGTKFSVSSQFSPFEEILEKLTKYRTTLQVAGTASRNKDSTSLTIESDFGKQMATEISETFQKQLAQIDDTLRTHILDSLFPLRQSLNEKLQEAENVLLAKMRNTLSDLELMMSSTKKYDPEAEKFKQRYSEIMNARKNL